MYFRDGDSYSTYLEIRLCEQSNFVLYCSPEACQCYIFYHVVDIIAIRKQEKYKTKPRKSKLFDNPKELRDSLRSLGNARFEFLPKFKEYSHFM